MYLAGMRSAFLALVFALIAASAYPKDLVDPVNSSEGFAINGYDPVAYFDVAKPVQGQKQFSATWQGATFLFSSAANRDKFQAAPEKFAPQFGGYCAWAVSNGYTATIDPQAWRIVDGKLYLNYSKSVQKKWQQDIPGRIAKAQENWPGLHK